MKKSLNDRLKVKLFTLTVALLSIAGSTFRTSAEAAENFDLTKFLNEEVSSQSEAVNPSDASSDSAEDDQRWFLRRFSTRLKPKVTFSIPGIAKLDIAPEVELVFQRELPEGWAAYKR